MEHGVSLINTGESSMRIAEMAKKELIDSLLKVMVTPNLKLGDHSSEDEANYSLFVKAAKTGRQSKVKLPLDFAIKDEMFNLIKDHKAFIESSVKFQTVFSTVRPSVTVSQTYEAKYNGNEFNYSFLDNHPGIINIDRLKDIPTDYEGLMAVPPTILEYKNLHRFNIHRIIYTPIHNGKVIYPRIVISNKVIVTD